MITPRMKPINQKTPFEAHKSKTPHDLPSTLTSYLISACGTAHAAETWTDLFNGNNLDGWVQRGGVATTRLKTARSSAPHHEHAEHLPLHPPRLRRFHPRIRIQGGSPPELRRADPQPEFFLADRSRLGGQEDQDSRRPGAWLPDRDRPRSEKRPLVDRRHLRRGPPQLALPRHPRRRRQDIHRPGPQDFQTATGTRCASRPSATRSKPPSTARPAPRSSIH